MPPSFDNGNYNETLLSNYAAGDTVGFECESETHTEPKSSEIECGDSGWIAQAVCTKSKSHKLH